VGYYAAKRLTEQSEEHSGAPVVVVGTAHPAKFPEAVEEATGSEPTHPTLSVLHGLPKRSHPLPCDIEAVKAYLVSSLGAE
jgi:threonine synthase